MTEALDTQRIDHLLDGADVSGKVVTVAGLGSGGATVIHQLAMCGVSRWHLFDPDKLEPVNLVKHPAMRTELGRPKADVLRDWLLDRNPRASVAAHAQDVRESEAFGPAVAGSDLVICAVDNAASRSWINETCVKQVRPCLTGSVIRTGLGGQIYLFAPGETGCLSCMQLVSDRNNLNLEDAIQLTDEEQTHRYGLGDPEFTTSGLAIDITLVAAFHAHMAWSVMFGGTSRYVPPLSFNWLTVGIRPERNIFPSHYEVTRVLVRPQAACVYGCANVQ